MNGGEIVVASLLQREVDTVFFVPGGTYITVLEALSRHQDAIRAVPTRLESSAVFAAEAYAAVRKKPACVFVSRAPGASNATIGIHTAMQASRPVVLFIANIPGAHKQREAFQEIDYRLMYAPIAKAVFDVHSINELAAVTARALDLAVSGRPGPVVVAVSRDIFDDDLDEPDIPRIPAPVRIGPDADAIAAAARLLESAESPIVLAGEMICFEAAYDELRQLAEAAGAGVMAAYRQQDVIDNDHPAYFGQLALNRLPFQERALGECDLIVAIGSRLDSVTTADYTMPRAGQKLVIVYPDPSVFSSWPADVALGSHCRSAMTALIEAIPQSPPAERLAWRDAVHAEELAFAKPGDTPVHGQVDMAKVVERFQARVPGDSIIVTDAGTFSRWVHRYYRFKHPATNLGPVSGAMGYGVPGGIGAAVANPGRPVFAWVGDGGFLMTGHEAAAIVQESLSVKIIVCDNSAWGSILVYQQKRYGDRDFGTRLKSPDFAALGAGYGMPSFTVNHTDEFAGALDEALAVEGPAMIHLLLDARDVSPFSGSAR